MGRLVRLLAAAFLLFTSMFLPGTARAVDIPDPDNSSIPPVLWLVGQTDGVADPCGEFVVHVAKRGGGNYVNGVVTLSFKLAQDLDFAATQPFPGVTVDCARREVYATTDVAGNAVFRVVGSCIQHPGGGYKPGPCEVQVSVDGVCLGDTRARAFDLDGQDGVNANDVSLWLTDFFCPSPYTCVEDYDNDLFLGASDVSHLVGVLNSHRSQETGDLCLAPPPPPPTPVTGGISLYASVDCSNGIGNWSDDYCDPNSFTDILGSVTIAGGIAQYTGVEAIVKTSHTTGAALPAYWRFDNLTIPADCPNLGGTGCNRVRLSAIRRDLPGDPNCIAASTAYDEATVDNPEAVLQWTLWPHPVTGNTSDAQTRVLYSIPGCVQGSIAPNTETVVFGLRIGHGPNPTLCAGCGLDGSILFSVEELRLTQKITGKASCSCTVPQHLSDKSHAPETDGSSAGMLIIRPGPGDLYQVYADGSRPTATSVEPPVVAGGAAWLAPAIPNPTGRGTVLKFYVPRAESVRLSIYDAAGRKLRSLSDGTVEAGVHQYPWDGRDDSGASVASGIYFVRLTVGGELFTKSVAVRQ